ncbi:PAS domain-containing sensor histidine kinase [Ancylomarina sp. DW003]|nr:PAS domain-containing sensor histidine kinase [Ancylomarina sp. DW003]MDE5421485.1 PAS domain-containing sensor histidine kinase [Ancylomarina sp. DW003]
MENQTDLINELKIQKEIAYTSGLLQGDVTIKTLLESLAEGVIFINESGRIILINDRLAELTGHDKHEVIGQHMNIFIPDDLHSKHDSHVKGYFKAPRIRPMGEGLELTAKRKDGSTFLVELSISFLNTESGKLGIGFLTDITTRKEAEYELKKRNQELDAYAHTVAHDLNSSLAGIVGFSELLINPSFELSKEEHDSYLNEIAEGGRKMSSIIGELLLFASMKKEDVDIGEINMRNIIDSACHRLKYQIEEKNVDIEISENISNCLGYSLWIEEVWLNYISNAIKYGGTPPKIKIYSTKTEDGYIKYSVEDKGEGISDDLKDIIFNERDKSKDKLTKGLGLGLSIVKRILEKLDGHVSLESEIGQGSIFSFYLKDLN